MRVCRKTDAESLIDAAVYILFPRRCLVMAEDGPDLQQELSLAVVSMRFYHMSLGFKFRAIVEGWSFDRIVREMNV